MLIVSRRVGESIIIGDDVKVTVVGMWGKDVRLGIDAPRHITVDRGEIAKRKRESAPAEVKKLTLARALGRV